MIARLEHMEKGDTPRYVVTNLEGQGAECGFACKTDPVSGVIRVQI